MVLKLWFINPGGFSLKHFSVFNGLHYLLAIPALMVLFFLFSPAPSQAQSSKMNEPVSITAANEPVATVLDRLSRNTGLTFSYNPDQLNTSHRITLNMVRKPLSEVLEAIFNPLNLNFRLNGNQLVIFGAGPAESRPSVQESAKPLISVAVPQVITRHDTVFLTSTTYLTDTITRTDTVLKFDTVFILKRSADERIGKGQIFSDLSSLEKELTRELRFHAGFTVNWMNGISRFTAGSEYREKLNDYKEAYSNKNISGSLALELMASYNRTSAGTGISYASFGERLSYSIQISTGGYFRKDTLDAYYTLAGADTSWFYVMDSTYIPLDLKQYDYRSSVRRNYIEIPLFAQYNFPVGQGLLYFRGGLIAGISSKVSGLYIYTDNDGAGDIKELEMRPIVFSWQLESGIQMPVYPRISVKAGIMYRRQMQSVYKDFPIETRIDAFGLSCGILYKI
ncbi:MAG TPA: STN domain-containing protein [Lentimicrobium sp.]|jgi:hypothetical protein|nr:STN domain-containing protein [Lentimicrobium sp.]